MCVYVTVRVFVFVFVHILCMYNLCWQYELTNSLVHFTSLVYRQLKYFNMFSDALFSAHNFLCCVICFTFLSLHVCARKVVSVALLFLLPWNLCCWLGTIEIIFPTQTHIYGLNGFKFHFGLKFLRLKTAAEHHMKCHFLFNSNNWRHKMKCERQSFFEDRRFHGFLP